MASALHQASVDVLACVVRAARHPELPVGDHASDGVRRNHFPVHHERELLAQVLSSQLGYVAEATAKSERPGGSGTRPTKTRSAAKIRSNA